MKIMHNYICQSKGKLLITLLQSRRTEEILEDYTSIDRQNANIDPGLTTHEIIST